MSCKKYYQDIYLYSELSPEEKESVDKHIQQCESCSTQLEQIRDLNELTRNAASYNILPGNATKLTHSIMHAIEREKKYGWFDVMVVRVNIGFVRYAFAACSLLLVGFFITEQFDAGLQTHSNTPVPAQSQVVLKTNSFFNKAKAPEIRFSILSLQACLEQPDCELPLIKKIKR